MMGSCIYLMVACMADTQNVRGKDDLGSQGRSSSHAVPYFFIRSSRSSPLPLQLVINCAVSCLGWVSNQLRWWGTIWEEVRTTEWTVPVFFSSLPHHFNSRGSPHRYIWNQVGRSKGNRSISTYLTKKKQVEKEDCEEYKGGGSTSFFRNPGNTCILSSPLPSIWGPNSPVPVLLIEPSPL